MKLIFSLKHTQIHTPWCIYKHFRRHPSPSISIHLLPISSSPPCSFSLCNLLFLQFFSLHQLPYFFLSTTPLSLSHLVCLLSPFLFPRQTLSEGMAIDLLQHTFLHLYCSLRDFFSLISALQFPSLLSLHCPPSFDCTCTSAFTFMQGSSSRTSRHLGGRKK